MEDNQICYGLVGNIPSELHSADVRAFFSQFVEEKGFSCFHYRHRPEVQKNDREKVSSQNIKNPQRTCCCIVKIFKYKMDEFIKMYNGQNWLNKAGKLYSQKVLISRIRLASTSGESESHYLTNQEKLHNVRTREEFAQSDMKKLPELNPPSIMPNGNVGTPLCIFIELIRVCKFPPHLIKKLGLSFPRNKKRKYGNVPFDYSQSGYKENDDEKVCDSFNFIDLATRKHENTGAKDEEICCDAQNREETNKLELKTHACSVKNIFSESPDPSTGSFHCQNSGMPQNANIETALKGGNCAKGKQKSNSNLLNNNVDEIPQEDESSDGELEEWDRHEALHNDVTSQERTKERLFEDYIELKWEKGGSGLVWYTDAAFWKQQEEADFDEETADDWDVDMSIYEGSGDMDSKALLQLRLEGQWRQGKDIDLNKVGSFEKYTRGIGGQVMKKQGWNEGQSLGKSQAGITEPISSEGQNPSSKRGLGYYGETLIRHHKKARPTREAVISTVYDKKEEKSAELFQSGGPFIIKYRDNVEFIPEKVKDS